MFKLEEILTLAAVVHGQAASAICEHLAGIESATSRQGTFRSSGYFVSPELELLQESIKWMHEGRKKYEELQNTSGHEYAGLSLIEFLAKIRPL